MTTIAGIAFNGKVFIAADQQVNGANYHCTNTAEKLIRVGDCLIGIAGDYRAVTTLPYLPTSKFKYVTSPGKFMQLTFPRLIREFFEQHGIVPDHFELLIGTKGMLFTYDSDDESVSPVGLYYAIGSGGSYALGALEMMPTDDPATTRARAAVKVGIKYDSQSGGEVEVLSQ